MPTIVLTNGMEALVDEEDFARLSAFRWSPVKGRNGAIYASRRQRYRKPNGTWGERARQMQRDVMDPDGTAPRDRLVDHRDGNTLDCRRSNLRWATYAESNRNRRYTKNRTGFHGVYHDPTWPSRTDRFIAVLMADRKRLKRTGFRTAEDAARAYNEMAIALHGEFATLNEVKD